MVRGARADGYQPIPSHSTSSKTQPTTHWTMLCKALQYLWKPADTPAKLYALRLQLTLSIILLVAAKFVALANPIIIKLAVDALTHQPPTLPTQLILAYGTFRFLDTLFSALRDMCFASVSANIERTASLEVFVHLNKLSLDFHLRRKTGAVIRSVSRGASSFTTVLRVVIFQLLPVFIQVVLVCSFLLWRYQWWFAVLTLAIMVLYFLYTIITTDWRNKFRREMNEKDNEFNQKAVDALLNFETVKYFNAEEHETSRYDHALTAYRQASILSQNTLALLNCGQDFIISAGVAFAMYLSGRLVVNGSNMTVGDFVLIQQFIMTLYEPLGFLGTYYRMLKQSLIDIESMLNLLNEEIGVRDDDDASEISVLQGRVTFEDVYFSYNPETPILKGISFEILPGERVAIVGSSGAGKSTIARLLYRFYDVTQGRILIDGQDIRHVTQRSLRQEIGIVPQDCVLFNDTIGYNIGYGIYGRNLEGPSVEEVMNAAEAASIHDFIEHQPNKYETTVGERGLRLSGGEKQRVAIARAILKDPKIMIFDEATSSLDTHTEDEIQKSLETISIGRSSLTIAHRLSTIIKCDRIIVLKEGKICEMGTHEELLDLHGEYESMWDRQTRIEKLQNTISALKKNTAADKSPKNNAEISHHVSIEVKGSIN